METAISHTTRERRQEFQEIISRLSHFYEDRTAKLVYHLYQKYDYSSYKIAEILDIPRQNVDSKWPKYPKKEDHAKP